MALHIMDTFGCEHYCHCINGRYSRVGNHIVNDERNPPLTDVIKKILRLGIGIKISLLPLFSETEQGQ
jgi:hypothetical protein